MVETFAINGKVYKAKEFDFNLFCELERYGVQIEDIGEKNLLMLRTYLAICGGLSVEQAGKEIESHVINGGELKELAEVMNKGLESSDFFRSLIKRAEEENPETQEEEKE